MGDRFMEQMKAITRDSDNEVIITETDAIEVYQHRVKLDSTDGAMTVNLPPVGEAAGQVYMVYVETYVSAITMNDADDSVDFTAPTFDGAGDGALFYSDGERWWVFGTRT